jgi:rubredoxin
MTMRCQVCGQLLATDEDVAAHEHELIESLEHAGPGFECPVCDAMFDTADHLVVHEAIHA